jgi:hypothetical protein
MRVKTIVTVLLLAFVAVSLGFMIFKEGRVQQAEKAAPEKQSRVLNDGKTGKATPDTPGKLQSRNQQSKVVVYYFHGNTRCFTCRAIENFSRAAVGNGFPDELQKGSLEFRAINVEEPSNEHFVRDYQLVTRSVVLVRYSDGKQVKWKNLDRVWELVRDNDAFARYVQTETKQFLGGS